MWRYVFRRLVQAVPTVAGVVLITFVLFNVVGGSPAAMVLGQNAGARSLEEFDAARGYNKPLFFGRWTSTRALEAVDFSDAPPSVRAQWGAGESGPLTLADGEALEIPFAFSLPEGETWRLTLEGRGPGFPRHGKKSAEFSTVWKKVFHSVENAEFRAEGGPAEIVRVRLERGTRHVFDSQWTHYLGRLLRLDFGVSTSLNQPVFRLLKAGIGPSLALTVPILLVELAVSLALALLCAYRRGTWLDRGLVGLCVALMSVNYLIWIVFGQYVLAYKLGWFPVWGFESWRNLLLPVLIGVATGLGVNVRFYRTILLEEMHKDYVKTAFAKGLPAGKVLFKHVLKNALGPVITNVALALPFLYTGSVLLESFFGIPGLGYLSLNAIHSSDVDVVRAVVLVGALLFTGANILADLALAWVDPRVKLS
ncbi:MAG: ABC transporter permease [Lentisphaerae bacterium]|nr:ABC transporter permease [Lentisphaerota bacterium]